MCAYIFLPVEVNTAGVKVILTITASTLLAESVATRIIPKKWRL